MRVLLVALLGALACGPRPSSHGATASGDSGTVSAEGDSSGGWCGLQECPCGIVSCGSCDDCAQACDACGQACDPMNACPEHFRCDYADGACGDGEPGTCVPRALDCGVGMMLRACACSGAVGPAPCVDIADDDISADATRCVDGTYACGDLSCQRYVEYCETTLSGVGGSEATYACRPADCDYGVADCACIDASAASCVVDANGQVQVVIRLP